jgi:hypothetical protein
MGNASMGHTYASTPTDGKTYLCLSIVTFVIRAIVERLANSSIYVFKRPSSSTRRDFANAVLNVEGSSEGDGGGNDAAP